jgi:predicted DNA-binding protein (MmcQ/YjbR family)
MAHPRMYDDSNRVIRRLRAVCLALPDAFEKEAWGECTFRVTGGSMFAMTDSNHHGSGHLAVWVKAPPMVQEILVHSDAKRFFVPPYVGSKGWVGVRLDYKVDWDEVAGILKDGYLMSAPKRRGGSVTSRGDETAPISASAKKRPSIARKTSDGNDSSRSASTRRSARVPTAHGSRRGRSNE